MRKERLVFENFVVIPKISVLPRRHDTIGIAIRLGYLCKWQFQFGGTMADSSDSGCSSRRRVWFWHERQRAIGDEYRRKCENVEIGTKLECKHAFCYAPKMFHVEHS